MDPEAAAQVTLAGYAAVATVVIVWQALRCELGWQAWLLYCIERVYVGLGYHWRANRRCPFPPDGPALIVANFGGFGPAELFELESPKEREVLTALVEKLRNDAKVI